MSPFWQALAAFVFSGCCAGVGALIAGRWLGQIKNAAQKITLAFGLGIVLVSYAMTAMVALGSLHTTAMFSLLALGFTLCAIYIVQNRQRLAPKRPTWQGGGALGTVIFVICLPGALMALAPPYIRDALIYHLTLPKAYLAHSLFELGRVCQRDGFYRPVLGMQSEEEFLSGRLPEYQAVLAINEKTPPNASILCATTGNRNYYLRREYKADTFIENHTINKMLGRSKNARQFVELFAAAKYTHLFTHLPILKKSLDAAPFRILSEANVRYGTVIHNGPGYYLIEIAPK